MFVSKRNLTVLGLLALFLMPAFAEEVAEPGSDIVTNVLLTFRIGTLEGDRRDEVKSYDLVVVSGGPGSTLMSGARVPLPTTSEDADTDDDGHEEVTYVYQNIGFTAQVHAWVMSDGRIKVAATMEDSFIEQVEDDGPPTVETRQVSVNALLQPGRPLVVTRVHGIRDRSGFVEVEAKTLD